VPSVKKPTFRRGVQGGRERENEVGRGEGEGEGVIKSSGSLSLPGLGWQSCEPQETKWIY